MNAKETSGRWIEKRLKVDPGSIESISKVDTILFTYLPYFVLFCLIPCHLDALKMSKSRLGLYNVHKL